MANYLKSIMSTLPAIQFRQVKDLLEDFKAKGKIRNTKEYTAALNELTLLVNADVPKPSFKRLFALVWHLCRSDSYSEMLGAAKNDIEAAFLQTDEIGKKLDDHHFLMMKGTISDLERVLSEQEATITKLEWLRTPNNEFTNVLINNFSSSTLLQTARSQVGADNYYCDNRTQTKRDIINLPTAFVDIYGKKLILSTETSSKIFPISVEQISDAYSYGTEINTEINNSFENLIDGEKGTFWQRNVYLSDPVEKVTTVLKFNFGKAQDVNYIVVEGASTTDFYIDSIKGVSPNGDRIILSSMSTLVEGKIRIDFSRTFLQAIEVTFADYTYEKEDFYTDESKDLYNIFDLEVNLDKADITDALSSSIKNSLINDELGKLCNISASDQTKVNKYIYSLALDNVWFGNGDYKETGIFVSKPMKIEDVGILSIKTIEEVDEENINSSVEYDIIKKDILPIQEVRFSIPKLDQENVVHERLVLTQQEENSILKDIGALRFCPYVSSTYSSPQPYPVKIYENGILLNIGSQWKYAISTTDIGDKVFDWKSTFNDAMVFSNYTLIPQKMWILIINPTPKSIYTVSYDIRTSNRIPDDTTVWLDKNQMVFMGEEGRVCIKENIEEVISSELYLQVTLRRNASSCSVTPELSQYTLLAAKYE